MNALTLSKLLVAFAIPSVVWIVLFMAATEIILRGSFTR